MQEIGNSTLLSKLIENARAVSGSDNGIFTAETLFISALEMLTDPSEPLTDEERRELDAFHNYFAAHNIRLLQAKEYLQRKIRSGRGMTYGDRIYILSKLHKAKMHAMELSRESVTADMVLMEILEDPSEALKADIYKGFWDDESDEPSRGKKEKDEERREIQELLDLVKKAKAGLESAEGGTPRRRRPERGDSTTFEPVFDEVEPETEEVVTKENVSSLVEVVKQTRAALLEKIFGQDNAVTVFTNGYFQGELVSLIDHDRSRPRATFLFAGPPGVGKTYLAETAAQVLDLPFKRFDMSEYADKEAVIQLCGSDGVFKDSQPGVLSGFVAENPKCILLFDEIEKAHANAIHLFLQILDAGRLMDAKTRKEVSFCDTICIFTTNAGKELYEESESGDLSGLSRKVILKALEKDVNPETKAPFFPPAICSRFASGNVVMFNRMSASNLRDISKNVIFRQIANLEKEVGIRSVVDENVFTALLLAEGGSSDARMIRGRSQAFYNGELFELLRLIDSEKAATDIGELEEVRFTVQLPEGDSAIRALFETPDDAEALVFAPQATVEFCSGNQAACRIVGTRTLPEAERLLHDRDIQFVMLDLDVKQTDNAEKFLNVEDIDSVERDFLWLVREKYPDMPIYLLAGAGEQFSLEEQISFRRIGVQGFIEAGQDGPRFAADVAKICENLHQQKSVTDLARSNKLLSFETGQRISPDGKTGEICLFDFELTTAVDAEDMKDMMSGVSKPDVRFDEIIGAEDAKKELAFFIEYLRNPKKYLGTGVSAPKGVLLYGPPGTGKTMLAKAMACEADVAFLPAEGNQFLKKYQGEGPQAVHNLFRAARRYAPTILFVDEIDAIAKQRTGAEQSEGREEILTSLLTEMDGFRVDPSKPVFVLAATNFDVDQGKRTSLDAAFLRRFDRRICVDLPTKEERIRYLKLQFGKKPIFRVSEEMTKNIAVRSTGMSLADLASVLDLSLRMAVQEGDLKVTDAVFEEAFETFHSGEEKKWDPAELTRTARHEAGHAFLSWQSGDKPSYLTIVARSDHGGYMQHGDRESKSVFTKEELLARIRTALGGRAAEIVYYGKEGGITTGASSDLATATSIAKRMICTYGMDAELGLSVLSPEEANTPEFRSAVSKLLADELEKAIRILSDNRGSLDALVEGLLNSNRLTGEEIDSILTQSTQAV